MKHHALNWLLVCVIALVSTALPVWLDGGPSDEEAAADMAASLADALAQAQAERPELWDEPSRQRARAAVQLLASGGATP